MAAAADDVDVPQGLVKGIAKRFLREQLNCSADKTGCSTKQSKEPQLQKDAVAAFAKASKVFITLVAATAHDISRESKRSTVSLNDVCKALEELEFSEILAGLESLPKQDAQKKRKTADSENNVPSKEPRTDAAPCDAAGEHDDAS